MKNSHRKPPPLRADKTLPLALSAAPCWPQEQVLTLARRLGIPLAGPDDVAELLLCWNEQGLGLRKMGDAELPGLLRADFTDMDTLRRIGRCHSELLVRAARVRGRSDPLFIDATAGLGRDGFLLAAAGFRVLMIERHPLIAALLQDGLMRAAEHPQTAAICARIQLVAGEALEQFAWLTEPPAVIYLDPMFPQRSKSAKVKQQAQLLQLLHGDPGDEETLFLAARALKPSKVVVKRPLKAKPLATTAGVAATLPSYALKGRAVRFDVYV